jgi:large subunit ribosomal protein L22
VATRERQEVRAEAKYLRVSPRKARLVADHIRGRSVPEARTVLAFTPRAVAREIEKILHSAVANAEANHGFVGDEMVVSAAYVDEGPTIKRFRARARGRVARIHKRTCHVTLKLSPLEADGRATAPAASAVPAKTTEPPSSEEKARARREAQTADEQAGTTPRKTRARKAAEPDEKPKRAPRRKKTEEAED